MLDAPVPTACMIFAAGFGTRMRPLTDTRPKPLIEVCGKALVDHAVDPARERGLDPIVVNAHYLSEQIVEKFRDTDVAVLVEEEQILDTGGGLKSALGHLGSSPVATMNSDAVWKGPNPYDVLLAAWNSAEMDALLLVCPTARARGRGDHSGDFQIQSDGQPKRGPGWVYCGAQIIDPVHVQNWPETVFSLNVVWDELMARSRLKTVEYPGEWCDVGRPSSIPVAEEMLGV